MVTIFCEGLRPRLTPRRLGAFDFGCSPQRANKNAPPNGVCTARQACALGCEGIVSKRLGSAYRSGRLLAGGQEPKMRPRSRARPKRIGAAEPRQREEHEAPTITRTTFPTYCFPAHAAFPNWSEGRHPHWHFRGPRHHAGNPGIGTPDVCRIRITLSSNTAAVATIAAILVSRPLAN